MSDALRLYHAVLTMINETLPNMLKENRITLAQMITGIIRGRNVSKDN